LVGQDAFLDDVQDASPTCLKCGYVAKRLRPLDGVSLVGVFMFGEEPDALRVPPTFSSGYGYGTESRDA
jgi:hypothetical protein